MPAGFVAELTYVDFYNWFKGKYHYAWKEHMLNPATIIFANSSNFSNVALHREKLLLKFSELDSMLTPNKSK